MTLQVVTHQMHPVKRLANGHAGCGWACVPTMLLNEFKTRAEHRRHEYKENGFCRCVHYYQCVASRTFIILNRVSFKQTNLSWSSLFSRSLDLVQYTHFLTCDCRLHIRAILTQISPQYSLSIIHCFFGSGCVVVLKMKLMLTNFSFIHI